MSVQNTTNNTISHTKHKHLKLGLFGFGCVGQGLYHVLEETPGIKAEIKKTDSEFDREKLQERLGKLAGGVAVIKVGAPTETAQKELKQRVEDAVAATRAAMEEGIVPGGGVALFNVHDLKAQDIRPEMQDVVTAAHAILMKAVEAPLRAIVSNSGEATDEIVRELKGQGRDRWIGFNAMTNKVENLKEAGIINPLKVTKTAFVNAVSVAATYLTVGAAVTNIPEKKEKGGGGMPPGMGGGMGMEDY